ncbi:trichothecene-4-o [Fusarium sporotrichioides]|uniref:Acetyltransferase TRI7 n=2 Tax=Fusarium sporotrichioides TaxID=5514 RepID=TRI7_FUSSP|nr:RecName: Full=Acetyltransferase TRI7; AltName: Full=Core trichothecene cluster (CTC) protein 7 [Fusarium sporotrichioides]AAK33076.1 Tri7 [Fusarium sporotrichioides]RGP67088.1 trichothecene-4-o [Fusarium sporotrichioides]
MDIASKVEGFPTLGILYYTSTLLAVCTYAALIIISIPKTGPASLVRYSSPAIVLTVGKQLFHASYGVSGSLAHRSLTLALTALFILQCCNFLVLTRLDAKDLAKKNIFQDSDHMIYKAYRVVCLIFNVRGIGTPWQAKHLCGFPRFYQRGKGRGPTPIWFILRQSLIVAWQCLLLDIIYTTSMSTPKEDTLKLFGEGTEYMYLDANAEQWTGRFIAGIIAWVIPGRVSIDLPHRVLSIISVFLGFSSPQQWPPLFGSMLDAYTIRGFWSTFWHSYCRWTLTTISSFICRDFLRLPRPSIVERYLNIAFVFLGSAVVHMAIDSFCWGPPMKTKLPTLAFFGSLVVGIIIEDTIQALCRRITGEKRRDGDDGVPVWHKLVGYIWVSFWFMMTSPWYLYHNSRLPPDDTWLVPVSFVDTFGLDTATMLLFGSGVILKFAIGIEV